MIHLTYMIVYIPRNKAEKEGNCFLRSGNVCDRLERIILLDGSVAFNSEGYAGEVERKFFGDDAGEELSDEHGGGEVGDDGVSGGG